MYALLSASSARMKSIDGVRSTSIYPPRSSLARSHTYSSAADRDRDADDADQCSTSALRHLRKLLESGAPLDEMVVLDVFFLGLAETYNDNFTAARTHLNMLALMVGKLGGYGAVRRYVLDMCVLGDIFLATREFVRPVFAVNAMDPGPLAGADMVRIVGELGSEGLGSEMGMGDEVVGDALRLEDPGFYQLVSDAVDLLSVTVWLWHVEPGAVREREWANRRSTGLLHTTLSMELLRDEMRQPTLEMLVREALRMALVSWFRVVMIGIAANPLVPAGTTRLHKCTNCKAEQIRRAVSEVDRAYGAEGWFQFEGLHFWLVTFGCMVAASADDKEWFQGRFARLVESLGIEDFEDALVRLRKYFFLDLFLGDPLRVLWDMLPRYSESNS